MRKTFKKILSAVLAVTMAFGAVAATKAAAKPAVATNGNTVLRTPTRRRSTFPYMEVPTSAPNPAAAPASAENLRVYVNEDGEVRITGYDGDPCGEFTLPATIGGKLVTSVGGGAFDGCSNLTEATIPSGVKSVGSYAFAGCSSLRDVRMPESVEWIGKSAFKNCSALNEINIPSGVTSIGGEAFSGCSKLSQITTPDGVTSIVYGTFSGCSSLTNVTIPDSVTSIGDHAFFRCTSLTSVKIGNGVTSIGDDAFSGCASLTAITVDENNPSYCDIDGVLFNKNKTELILCPEGRAGEYTIPDSVTSIGWRAFENCTGLTSVAIPDSVTSIGNYAFEWCSSLTSVKIGSGLTSIGVSCLLDSPNLAEITVASGNPNYSSLDGVLFNKDKTILIQYPIGNARTAYTIPDGVTSIGRRAFSGCTSLTSVTIPYSVTEIGYAAFEDCDGLTSVKIGSGLTEIGGGLLDNSNLAEITVASGNPKYSSLDGVLFNKDKTELITYPPKKADAEYTIPDSVTSIGWRAFEGCGSLTSVTIPDGVTSIGGYAFYNTGIYNDENNWENGVLYIGNHLIKAKSGVVSGDYTIKAGTKIIADRAFYNCYKLTSVIIPDGVTSIGYSAFSGCDSLTSVTIPDSVTKIESSTFSGCSSLTSVTIPDSITSIGGSAFSGCTSLTSVKIPDSVTSIGDYAFGYCTSLTAITVGKNNPGYCDIDGVLFNKDKTILIQYPIGNARTAYTIPDGVTSIGRDAFWNCKNLTSVTIPDGVTSIGEDAFAYTGIYNDENNWENGVLYIGNHLIRANPYVVSGNYTVVSGNYTIKAGTKTIADYAFSYCRSLTSVTIPDSVTSIGDSAFAWCSSLTSVTIPDSVTSIGYHAFYGCAGLTSVTIPDSVTEIGEDAFAGTGIYGVESRWENGVLYIDDNLVYADPEVVIGKFTIKDGTKKVAGDAFRNCSGLTDVAFPDSVEYVDICQGTFEGCSNLQNINAPRSVTEIVYGRTYRHSSLDGVLFNENKTRLELCPEGRTGEYIIPDGVTSIGGSAFKDCAKLTDIVVSDSVTSIGWDAFSGCASLTSVTIGSGLTRIGYSCLLHSPNLAEITVVPDNPVYSSLDGALFDKHKETLIYYPEDKSGAYTVPDSVTWIYDAAFSGCADLTSVTIPDSVTSIGEDAFEVCTSLKSVTIGNGVTSIDNWAFYGCSALKDVYYGGSESDWQAIAINNEFNGNDPLLNANIHYNWTPTHVHEYEWVVVKEPQIGVEGLEVYKCKVCGDISKERAIPALSFTPEDFEIKIDAPEMKYGETNKITVGALPEGCEVRYKAEPKGIVEVYPDGTIITVGEGTVVITATLYDASGNRITNESGNPIAASQKVTVKRTLMQKIVLFLENILTRLRKFFGL